MRQILNSLQQEAAEMLASGKTAQQTKDELALSVATFEQWRQDPLFVSEVGRLRAERKAGADKAAESGSEDALDAELDRMATP